MVRDKAERNVREVNRSNFGELYKSMRDLGEIRLPASSLRLWKAVGNAASKQQPNCLVLAFGLFV